MPCRLVADLMRASIRITEAALMAKALIRLEQVLNTENRG